MADQQVWAVSATISLPHSEFERLINSGMSLDPQLYAQCGLLPRPGHDGVRRLALAQWRL